MRRSAIRLVKHIFFVPAFETALRKLTSGKEYGTFISRLAPTQDQYPKNTFREVTVNGINFRLDISDLMGWFVFWGFSEKARLNLYKLAKPGDVVLDVGANIGDVSLNMARIVGDLGKVYAFEPVRETFEKLKYNCGLNSFTNLELVNVALDVEKRVLHIKIVDEHNSGMNRIVAVGQDISTLSTIETIRMDEYAKASGISRIDLIKIDVEGFEMNVLRGGRKSLEAFRPKLFIEIDDDNLRSQNSSAREVLEFLTGLGYVFSNAADGSIVTAANDLRKLHFDLVALLPE